LTIQHTLPQSPLEAAFARASTADDYFTWLDHVSSAAGCAQPIRLSGRIATVDQAAGKTIAVVTTEDMPNGVI
jgi:hypothetical protein